MVQFWRLCVVLLLNLTGAAGFQFTKVLARAAGGAVRDDRCLKFVHVPKTGGTTLESTNLHIQDSLGNRSFDSLAARLYEREGEKRNSSPATLFDWAHEDKPPEVNTSQGIFYWLRWGIYATFNMTDLPGGASCQDFHTPPYLNSAVSSFFTAEPCTTFALVREPLDRLISAYKFLVPGTCSAAAFSDWAKEMLPSLQDKPYQLNCFLVPQIEFVRSPRDPHGLKYVDRVLKQENFTAEVNALMSAFGKPLRVDAKESHHLFSTSDCHIDADDVPHEIKGLVYKVYREDYEAFGYPPPA